MVVESQEVRDALNHINSAELEFSDTAGGMRVAVSEDEIGEFFKQVRINGFDADSVRLGDTLVAHIPAEQSSTLGELFG
jgi:hypothetical protein